MTEKVTVGCPDEREMRRAIMALSGVFAALSWLEVEAVDQCISASEQADARGCLVLAGELLCKGLIDRT